MDDTRKEEILDKENALRDYLMRERDTAAIVLGSDEWQGIVATMYLDVITSGLKPEETVDTTLAMGWIIGQAWGQAEDDFMAILKDFPSSTEIQEFWTEKVQEVVEKAREDLLRRPGEEE